MGRNKKNNYLNDTDLLYEIILSKGKGFLTKKAINYLIILGNHVFLTKLHKYYYNEDDAKDCCQNGMLHMLRNWDNFNEKKYDKAIPFYTEVFKRGMCSSFNQLNYINDRGRLNMISLDYLLDNDSADCKYRIWS